MEKDEDHVSNLYDAPMPYMLRLTNDGVAIHGSEVEWGLATHGCIGIPTKFAALLFSQAGLVDHVIITKGHDVPCGLFFHAPLLTIITPGFSSIVPSVLVRFDSLTFCLKFF